MESNSTFTAFTRDKKDRDLAGMMQNDFEDCNPKSTRIFRNLARTMIGL